MRITVQVIDDVSVIAVSGRIDSISSADLEKALRSAIDENCRIIMDLADTEYISSSGLRVLLAGQKLLRTRQGGITLTSLQPLVRDVFNITGLANLFSIKKDLEEALSSLRSKH